MATNRDVPSTTVQLPRHAKRTRYFVFAGVSLALLAGCASSSNGHGTAAPTSSATATTSRAAPATIASTPTPATPITITPVPTAPATIPPSTTAPTTTTTAPTTSAPVTTGSAATAPAATTASVPLVAAGGSAVTIIDFAFGGGTLAVKVGATVTWTNGDPFAHSVVSKDGVFQSDTLVSGAKFAHTFDTAGTFSYICGIHPYMSGEIDVTT